MLISVIIIVMNYIAHNGVNHSTAQEASVHFLSDGVKIAVALIALTLAVWLIMKVAKKLGFITVSTKNNREK